MGAQNFLYWGGGGGVEGQEQKKHKAKKAPIGLNREKKIPQHEKKFLFFQGDASGETYTVRYHSHGL